MTQTPNPPAGWYPQGNQERWWDGTAWSDNFRPLGAGQPTPAQPTPVQPVPQAAPQPGYAQPAYGTPQPYQVVPAKQSHTARNILIVLGVLFVLFVGGCIAVVAVVGKKVNDVAHDDTVGGPNHPLTITEGKAFEVDGFEYAAGWSIVDESVGQSWSVDDFKVTNNRGKADWLLTEIKLYDGSEVVATATCTAGNVVDKIPKDTTVSVDCTSTSPLPTAYDKITIQDAV
jgi:hypothetical protein